MYGLQPVGLDGQEEPLTDLSAMASLYVDAIRKAQPEGHYRIGGTSLGGDIAWEMARQLDEVGQQVSQLVPFDVHGPVCLKALQRIVPLRRKFLRELERVRNHWMNLRWRDRHQRLAYEKKVARTAYQRAVQRITRVSRDNQGIQRVSHANRQAMLSHTQQPTWVPITLFRARAQFLSRPVSRALGWENQAEGGIEIHGVPGYYGELCREPYVRHWVDQLDACLRESGSTR